MKYKVCLLLYLFVLQLLFLLSSPAFAVTTHYYWVNMSQGYSSNIGRTTKPTEKDEYITNLGAGFSARRIEEKWNLNVTYRPAFIRYWKEEQSTDIINLMESNFAYTNPLTRSSSLRLQVSDNISRVKKIERGREGVGDWTHMNDLSVIPSHTYNLSKNTNFMTVFNFRKVNSFSEMRQDYTRYGVAEDFTHSFSFNPRLSSSINVSYGEMDWERSEDSNSVQGNINLSYRVSPLTIFTVGSGYGRRKFEESKEEVSNINYQIGLEKIFTRFTTLSLSYNRDAADDVDKGFIYFSNKVSATVKHNISDRDLVYISAYSENRDFKLAHLEEEFSGFSLDWTKALSQYISLSLLSGFNRHDYFGPRIDEAISLTAILSHKLSKHLFASLDYSYRENNSTDINYEYVENTAFLNLRLASGQLPGAFPYFGAGEVK